MRLEVNWEEFEEHLCINNVRMVVDFIVFRNGETYMENRNKQIVS